jgi:hypothetical protein
MGEPSRKNLKCNILVRGSKNSILVELETGEKVVTSRYAVREIKESDKTFDKFFE